MILSFEEFHQLIFDNRSILSEHLQNLQQVLSRLNEQGLGIKLKKEKCTYVQTSVEYLGYVVDANGVHTSAAKLEAI